MRFSVASLLLVIFAVHNAVSLYRPPPIIIIPPHLDLQRKCDGVQCSNGEFCRVTRQVCGDVATYSPVCVSCIPKDIDAICNSRGYARAVLLHEDTCCSNQKPKTALPRRSRQTAHPGPGRHITLRRTFNARKAQPHMCHVYANGPGRVACPNGSYCAPLSRYDTSGFGVCCYKQSPKVDQPTTNDGDKVCGLCEKECGPREECKVTVEEFGQKTYTCQPKRYPGCRSRPLPCTHHIKTTGKACKNSHDCTSRYHACCPTDCSVDSFVCRPKIAY